MNFNGTSTLKINNYLLSKKSLNLSVSIILSLYALIYIGIMFATDKWLLTEEAFLRSYNGDVGTEGILSLLNTANSYKWAIYALNVMLQVLKIGAVAMLVYMAAYLADIGLRFGIIFRCAAVAEFVMLLPYLWRFLVFYQRTGSGFDLEELRSYSALSLMTLIEMDTISEEWSFVMQALNLFEVLYCLVFAYLLRIVGEQDNMPMKLVITSYLPAKIFFIICMIFLAQVVTF